MMRKYQHGGDVWQGDPVRWLDFSSNMNPLGCPPELDLALEAALREVGYYPDPEMESAKDGLARMLAMSADNILPVNGGIGALYLAFEAVRPQRIVSVTPAFVEYERLAASRQIPYIPVSMLQNRHTIEFPLQALHSVLQEGDMLIIANPSNPVGYKTEQKALRALVRLTAECKATLLLDEAFIDFCTEGSLRNLVPEAENLLIAGSLTKIFSIPGVRLGYLLSSGDLMERARLLAPPWLLSAFASVVAGELQRTDNFVRQTVQKVAELRADFKKSLERLGLYVFPSAANFLLVDMRPVGFTAAQVAEALRRDFVLIRNCENYIGLDEYYMRLAVKSNKDNNRLVGLLAAILGAKL